MIRVLNLFAGIGGNRKLWENVDVTAVEYEKGIADIYKSFFPKDDVIVGDAHGYLLENYKDFDFIWSSPPCQSHSQIRKNLCVNRGVSLAVYPDMRLYQEIIFLKNHCTKNQKWVVENVMPYYDPLMDAQHIGRHLFWANFEIEFVKHKKQKSLVNSTIPELQKRYGFDLSTFKVKNKRQILKNCVTPELGLHVLKNANPKTDSPIRVKTTLF